MADKRYIRIRNLIYLQYAKIITRWAFPQGYKGNTYGCLTAIYNELKQDKEKWNNILYEDKRFTDRVKPCNFCGKEVQVQLDKLVHPGINITDKCSTCTFLNENINHIWICKDCLQIRENDCVYSLINCIKSVNEKLDSSVPEVLEKKYLKMMYHCHTCAGTLNDRIELNKYSVLSLDIVNYLNNKST